MTLLFLCMDLPENRNGELLTALADALLEKGVASVRFDFNGHGGQRRKTGRYDRVK